MHNIPCPVCKQLLKPTDNPNTLICNQRKVFVKELNTHIDTIHAMYCLNEDGSIPLRVIEIPPYAFEIHSQPEKGLYKTILQRVVGSRERRGHKVLQRETLLTLPGIVSCPWHDQKAVFDKIKMLMLFS